MTTERRSAFRCRTQLDDVGILRTDKEDIIVSLLEESSCGFGVLIPAAEISLQLDQEVDMVTRRGSYKVSVRHITPQAEGYRLGLKLIREVGSKADIPTASHWGKRLLVGNRFGGGKVSAALFLLVVFGAGAAAPFLLGWSGDWGFNPELRIAHELPMAKDFQQLLDSREFSQALNLSRDQETRIENIVDEQFAPGKTVCRKQIGRRT